jgi:hypothetical protein
MPHANKGFDPPELIAKDSSCVLDPHLVGDARFRQAHRFGERCMGPARAARQIWDEAGHCRVAVAIERAQINVSSGAAGGAIDPREMVPGRERGADRRRKQQGHSPGLALVPNGDQAFRVRVHLSVRRAPGGSLSVGFGLPLSSQLSAIKPYSRIVAEPGRMSTTPPVGLRPALRPGSTNSGLRRASSAGQKFL